MHAARLGSEHWQSHGSGLHQARYGRWWESVGRSAMLPLLQTLMMVVVLRA